MRTDRSSGRLGEWVARALVGGALCLAGILSSPGEAAPQDPLFLIDADTKVASVRLAFEDTRTLERSAILDRVGLQGPGFLERVRGVVDVLPLIDPPVPHPFSGLEMARDAARIEQFYAQRGFLEAEAEYEVEFDAEANTVEVTYRITEGRPLTLASVEIQPAAGALALDSASMREWARFEEDLGGELGSRLSEADRVRIRSRPLSWLRRRGYPFASVDDSVVVDSTESSARLRLDYDPGVRARVDSIVIEGLDALGYRTVRREIPIDRGDWFSESRMAEGRRQVVALNLVRLALFDVAPGQPVDSTVTLRMRVEEGSARLLSGELGYATERGIATEARWDHRDFRGGARTLSLSTVANTGWLAASRDVDRLYGASATLRQPYLFDYRLSASVRPFAEYRDDIRDESFAWGSDASLLFERGSLKRASTTVTVSRRRVIDAPGLAGRGDVPDTLLLTATPVDVGTIQTSRLGLDLVFGEVDDPLDPRDGYITRLSTEVAGPAAISDVEYSRLDAQVTGLLPLGRSTGLVARTSVGRLFPRGASVPDDPADALTVLLQLRDAVFTAGGTGDVRGWGNGQLGPKVPDLRIARRGDSVSVAAERYVVLSGLARATASLELRLPFPLLGGDNGTHLFLDAGRIWNPDDRFRDPELPADPLDQEGVFFGTGFGVEFATPVGPFGIDLGYKLNPSPLDLRDPGAVARALVAGAALSTVPTESIRRWHLHVSIGRSL